MPETLQEVEAQIAELQRKAEQMRKEEITGVIDRIREAIAHYHLTPEQLFGAGKAAKAGKPAKASPEPHGAIKYRDAAGHAWTGRGRRPQWYLDALAAGKSDAELRA